MPPFLNRVKERAELLDPLYANRKSLKLQNIITLNNSLFICDQLCDNLSNYFKLQNQHRHSIKGSNQFTLNVPIVNTETYGSNSIKIKAIKDWNETTKKIYFNSDLLFKWTEYVRLVKASF